MAKSSIKNLDKLNKKLSAIPERAKVRIRKAMGDAAQEITATMKALAPVDSGALRLSISYTFGDYRPDNSNVRGVKSTRARSDLSVTIHAGDKDAWYAALVEFGTAAHTIRPQRPGGLLNIHGRFIDQVSHPGATASPFFFPAFRMHRKSAKSKISRAITRAAKDIAAGK